MVSPSGRPLPESLSLEISGDFEVEGKGRRKSIPLDGSGAFRIEGLVPGSTCSIRVWAFHCSLLASDEEVPCGTQDLVLTLEAMDGIRGRVLDEDGRPAGAGLLVEAVRTQRGWCGTLCQGDASAARTEEDGTFVLEYLGARDFRVTARGEGEQSSRVGRALLIPAGSTEVVLRLAAVVPGKDGDPVPAEPSPHEPAPSAIAGRLLSRGGADLPQHFLLQVVPEAGGDPRHVFPSPRGFFDTGTLPAGSWTLRAVSPSRLVAGERKGVRGGARGVEIPLDPGGTIEGRVFAADGTPAGAGIPVRASAGRPPGGRLPGDEGTALTREDGTFLVEYLGEGPFTLSMRSREPRLGRKATEVPGAVCREVPTGSRWTTLRFVVPAAVTGVLLSAEGNPVRGVRVAGHQEERESGDSCTTGPKGEYRWELAPGPFRASFSRGEERIDLGEFEAPAEGLVLRLPEGAEAAPR